MESEISILGLICNVVLYRDIKLSNLSLIAHSILLEKFIMLS